MTRAFALLEAACPIRLVVDSCLRALSRSLPNDFLPHPPAAGTTVFRAKSHPDWTRIGELLLICISLIGLAYFIFGPR